MKELYTEIEINAPKDKVWSILIDFESYPRWNPFIQSISGELKMDAKLKVVIQPPNGSKMTFKPLITGINKGSSFEWLGHLFFSGVFDGNHIFELVGLPGEKTKLIQREKFSGFLVNSFWKKLDTDTRKGFEMMNERIKQLAEEV